MENFEINECGTLLLRTCNAIANDTVGSTHTWLNVDMRSVLGDLWDRYDYFNLTLTAVAVSTMTASSLVSHDKALTFFMTGLNWENCNYDINLKHNSSRANIYTISYDT